MMSGTRRWVGLGIVLSLGLAGCNLLKKKSPAPDASTAAPTAWREITRGIRPDGSVPLDVALKAFSATIAPLPGVTVPPRDGSLPRCGTLPILWVAAHANELTPAQRAAYTQALSRSRPALNVKNELQWDYERPPSNAVENDMRWAHGEVERFFGAFGWVQPIIVPAGVSPDAGGIPGGRYAESIAVKGERIHWLPVLAGDRTSTNMCVIRVRSDFGDLLERTRKFILVHELTHCVQHARFAGTLAEISRSGGWVLEGYAEWVAWRLAPPDPDEWPLMIEAGASGVQGALDLNHESSRYPGGLSIFLRAQRAGVPQATIKTTGLSLLDATSSAEALARVEGLAPNILQSWGSELVNRPQLGAPWGIPDNPGPPAALFRMPAEEGVVNGAAPTVVSAGMGVQQVTHVTFDRSVQTVRIKTIGSGRGVFGRIDASGAVDAPAPTALDWTGVRDFRVCFEQSATCPGPILPRDKGLLLAVSGGSTGASVTLHAGEDDPNADARCLVGRWQFDDSTATVDTQRFVGDALTVTSMKVVMTLEITLAGETHEHVTESTLLGTSPDRTSTVKTTIRGDVDGRVAVNAANHTLLMSQTRDATTTDLWMQVGNQPFRQIPVPRGSNYGRPGFDVLGMRSPAPFVCTATSLAIAPPEMRGATMRFRKLP